MIFQFYYCSFKKHICSPIFPGNYPPRKMVACIHPWRFVFMRERPWYDLCISKHLQIFKNWLNILKSPPISNLFTEEEYGQIGGFFGFWLVSPPPSPPWHLLPAPRSSLNSPPPVVVITSLGKTYTALPSMISSLLWFFGAKYERPWKHFLLKTMKKMW